MPEYNWGRINCSHQIKGFQKQHSHLWELLKWISRSHQIKQFCKWCSVKEAKIRGHEQIQFKINESITSQSIKEWMVEWISQEKRLVMNLVQEGIHKVDSNLQLCHYPNTQTIFWRGLLKIQILCNHLI